MSEVLHDLIQTFVDNGLSEREAKVLAEKAAKDFEFAKKNVCGTVTTYSSQFSGPFATFFGVDNMSEMDEVAAFLNRETAEAADLLEFSGRNRDGALTPEDMWYEDWLRIDEGEYQVTFTGPKQSVVWDRAKKRWFVVDNEG